jgi:hypothetical protein
MDTFLKDQLELLKKLNERVSKIQDDVNHNVALLAKNRGDAERRRLEGRVYRQRDPANDRRKAEASDSHRQRRHAAGRHK